MRIGSFRSGYSANRNSAALVVSSVIGFAHAYDVLSMANAATVLVIVPLSLARGAL